MAPTAFLQMRSGLGGLLSHPYPSSTIIPTQTLPEVASNVLTARQGATTTVVAQSSGAATLSGGAIAGIVIGSIVGFLLILWIIRSCLNLGSPGLWGATFAPEREKYVEPQRHHSSRRSRSRHSHHSHNPRRVSVVETTRPASYSRRSRSPRAPPAAYQRERTSLDTRGWNPGSDGHIYGR
ncbi:hypothetical protein F5Y16DRAFT_357872 [Xylariaceae sp. FL0255]|nr:hypothetical protein F5Y16DRAFT_357872 [Xylariaceae sp. FL0255]